MNWIIGIITGLIFGTTVYYERPIDIPIEDNWSGVIEHLAWCESRNNPMAINRFDPDTPSYGLLQFKINTFNGFGEQYGLKHTDILNSDQQIAIAVVMLEDGLWRHWYNCLKDLYLI